MKADCPSSGVDDLGRSCVRTPPDPCGGTCVPPSLVGEGWSDPVLVWVGPRAEAPACPESAPIVAWQGASAFSVEPFSCPACVCDPPDVQCQIPTFIEAHTAIHCVGETTPFHGGNTWDGSCSTSFAVQADKMCGNLPCVSSVAIEAPVVKSAACNAHPAGPLNFPEPVTDVVVACKEAAPRSCVDQPERVCQSFAPEGFESCIFHEGTAFCPESYPARYGYFAELKDTRACSPCSCMPSGDGVCDVEVTVFKNLTCTESGSLGSVVVKADEPPGCLAVPTGAQLGSKTAEILDFNPGSCAPRGGKGEGLVFRDAWQTFCCRHAQ